MKPLAPAIEPPSFLYIQMDFCERTLRDLIDEDVMFENPTLIWKIFGQILEGLIYIHSKAIVHRDVRDFGLTFRTFFFFKKKTSLLLLRS